MKVGPVDGSPVEWTNWLPDNPNVVKGIDDYGYMVLTAGTKYGKIDSDLGKLPEFYVFNLTQRNFRLRKGSQRNGKWNDLPSYDHEDWEDRKPQWKENNAFICVKDVQV